MTDSGIIFAGIAGEFMAFDIPQCEPECSCAKDAEDIKYAALLEPVSLLLAGKSLSAVEGWEARETAVYELAHLMYDMADYLHETLAPSCAEMIGSED